MKVADFRSLPAMGGIYLHAILRQDCKKTFDIPDKLQNSEIGMPLIRL